MINNLVFSNFLHRPARTLVSILGIALGVLLIIFTVGLANGSIRQQANLQANVNAEIFLCPAGSICVTGNANFRLPESLAEKVQNVKGVRTVVPIGQKTVEAKDSKVGERLVDGIDFDRYSSVVGLKVVSGRKFDQNANEVILDTAFINQKKYKLGDKMVIWDQDFTIVGTYEPAVGARVKVPLKKMQQVVGGEEKATGFLVKIEEGFTPEQVATTISEEIPDTQIILTKDLEELYMSAIPALGVFLNVIVGVAAIISALVILLTMYTTVTERTRQIGIMKSLGMSNAGIAWIITQEALLISVFGIIGGILLTVVLRFLLSFVITLTVELDKGVIAIVTIVGLLGGALGGLYPALRAAKLDAVDALGYE